VRLRSAHRLSAILLGVFIIGHIVNQSLAFVSVASYAAMRGAMRVATQQSISYTVIVTMVAMQMMTGVAMGLKGVRDGALARNVQAVSGWYLAAFLLAHVFDGYLRSRPAGITPVAGSLVPPYCWPTPGRSCNCRTTGSAWRRFWFMSVSMPGSRRSGGSRNRLSGVGRTPLRWSGRWSSGPSAWRYVEDILQ